MSEETAAPSLQDIIQAAVNAEKIGVPVDWKAMCLQTYQVAMHEIQSLQPVPEEADEDTTLHGAQPEEADREPTGKCGLDGQLPSGGEDEPD